MKYLLIAFSIFISICSAPVRAADIVKYTPSKGAQTRAGNFYHVEVSCELKRPRNLVQAQEFDKRAAETVRRELGSGVQRRPTRMFHTISFLSSGTGFLPGAAAQDEEEFKALLDGKGVPIPLFSVTRQRNQFSYTSELGNCPSGFYYFGGSVPRIAYSFLATNTVDSAELAILDKRWTTIKDAVEEDGGFGQTAKIISGKAFSTTFELKLDALVSLVNVVRDLANSNAFQKNENRVERLNVGETIIATDYSVVRIMVRERSADNSYLQGPKAIPFSREWKYLLPAAEKSVITMTGSKVDAQLASVRNSCKVRGTNLELVHGFSKMDTAFILLLQAEALNEGEFVRYACLGQKYGMLLAENGLPKAFDHLKIDPDDFRKFLDQYAGEISNVSERVLIDAAEAKTVAIQKAQNADKALETREVTLVDEKAAESLVLLAFRDFREKAKLDGETSYGATCEVMTPYARNEAKAALGEKIVFLDKTVLPDLFRISKKLEWDNASTILSYCEVLRSFAVLGYERFGEVNQDVQSGKVISCASGALSTSITFIAYQDKFLNTQEARNANPPKTDNALCVTLHTSKEEGQFDYVVLEDAIVTSKEAVAELEQEPA